MRTGPCCAAAHMVAAFIADPAASEPFDFLMGPTEGDRAGIVTSWLSSSLNRPPPGPDPTATIRGGGHHVRRARRVTEDPMTRSAHRSSELVVRYGDVTAVDSINFDIAPGELGDAAGSIGLRRPPHCAVAGWRPSSAASGERRNGVWRGEDGMCRRKRGVRWCFSPMRSAAHDGTD